MKNLQKPKINKITTVAKSSLFCVEQVDLTFSNGEKRTYERMKPGQNAVMIVPISGNELLLIREYAVGIEDYQLGFPKGAIEPDENIFLAANRELMEEVGFGAKHFSILSQMTTSPSYFANQMTIIIAEDLYPEKRQGDEPEPLQIIRWPVTEMMSLLNEKDFHESRNICALFLAREYLNGNL